jgi:type IV pilus assembly protein PilY1
MKKIYFSFFIALICNNVFSAPQINPSNIPLETGIASLVKPNLMFIFDNSDSMSRNYLGDEIGGSNVCTGYYPPTPSTVGIPWNSWTVVQPQVNYTSQAACDANLPPNVGPGTNMGDIQYRCSPEGYYVTPKTCTGQVGDNGGQTCTGGEWVYYNYRVTKGVVQVVPGATGYRWLGDRPCNMYWNNSAHYEPLPPFASYAVNKIVYNPNIIYKAAVDYRGVSMGDQSITSAKLDPFNGSTSTMNLLTQLTEPYWCTVKTPTASQLADPNVCRRNGVDGANPFNYYDTTSYPNDPYYYYVSGPAPIPFYYEIIPTEFCDVSGVNCSFSQSPSYPTPFKVRWCTNWANASSSSLMSGAGKCQANYTSTYPFPRFGKFQRFNVPPSQYTNYANWFTYYRTRLLSLKTSAGLAFSQIGSDKRVGFMALNPTSTNLSSSFLAVSDFTSPTPSGPMSLPSGPINPPGTPYVAPQKPQFFSLLYGLTVTGDTDLKAALSKVGRYYAGNATDITTGKTLPYGTTSLPDPVQYSCQQNFTLLATDGYWNPGTNGKDLQGNILGNYDNVNSNTNYSLRSDGVFDGALPGSTGTLADVSLYYYKTPLRDSSLNNCTSNSSGTAQNLCQSNVPISALDQNPNQHMVTYAMSLGVSGLMNYTNDYPNGTSNDLQNIKTGAVGVCSWTTGVCDWPVPVGNSPSALDDLWHATINGRGRFFNANDANSIISGLQSVLTSVSAQTGSSSAAVTSSPNITATDNTLYYATYRTNKWDGEITSVSIDSGTGVIGTTPFWSARTLLNNKVSSNSDSRKIYFVRNNPLGTSSLNNFSDSNMNALELNNFTNKCLTSALSQCVNLSAANKTLVDSGSSLITYLRGQSQYDVNNSAQPLFRAREYVLGDIVNSAPAYVAGSRYGWSDSGYSNFASNVASRAPALYAGANDGMLHGFNAKTGQENWAIVPSQMMSKMYKLADTSYATTHNFYVDGNISVMDAQISGNWKTVLITGMGAGGNGYMAVDVTDPNNPSVLWEICNSSICTSSDADMGLSFGNPIITKRKFDGKWVAYLSSGYDNVSGKGVIYEVDLTSGVILRKLVTGTGQASPYNQAGISKINAYYDNFNADNTAVYLYAGDLNGNVWKWDLGSSSNTTATLLAQAVDPSGNAQPITTKIEVGKIDNNIMLYFATGQFLNNSDYTTIQIQSVYGIKDTDTQLGVLRNNGNVVKQTITTGSISSTGSNLDVDLSSKMGWYFDLTSQMGERVNVDVTLALGVLNVVTNIPGNSSCTAGGNSWIYQVDYAKGSSLDPDTGIVGKKTYTGLIVGQVIAQLGKFGALKDYLTDANGQVMMVSVPTKKSSGNPGVIKKHFWSEINKD